MNLGFIGLIIYLCNNAIADSIYSKNSKGTSDEAEYYAIKKIKKNPALKEPVPTDDFVTSVIGEKGQELHKIDEASFLNLGKGVVDDGPGAFYGDMRTYKSEMEEVIGTLGWDIIDYLMDEDTMESFTDTEYPVLLEDRDPLLVRRLVNLSRRLRYLDTFEIWKKWF